MNIQVADQQTNSEATITAMGTDPIPAGPYYREDYYDLEREAIFRRCWLQIGHVCELSEQNNYIVRNMDILGASVLITRGKDDQIRAFYNVCTHRGTLLVDDEAGKRSLFTCRYHGWTFDNGGMVRAIPDQEKFALDEKTCNLRPIAVDVCAGLIFVNFAKSPQQSLRESLGPIAQHLEQLPLARATTYCEYVYDIDANWKLTYDNFQENYHLRFIHPRTGASGAGEENPFGYPSRFDFYGRHRTQTIWLNHEFEFPPVAAYSVGKGAEHAIADGYQETLMAPLYYALFPNFFALSAAAQHFTHTVIPVGPKRSRGIIRFYWIGEDDSASKRFAREYALASMIDLHSEDRSVIEAGQQGLASGALEHIHFQSNEVLCRHLYYTVNNMIEAYKAETGAGGA